MSITDSPQAGAQQKKRMDRWLHRCAPIAIIVFGWLIYAHTFHSPFHLDDGHSIIRNVYIRTLSDPAAILEHGRARSLTFLTFALNYAVHGTEVFGYHVVNVGIHLANALLVFWLTLLLCRAPALQSRAESRDAPWIALLAGLLFVAHPLQTQAVTYIVQRLESLAAGFYLLCVALYLKARLRQLSERRWMAWYVASLLVGVLGAFAKETMVSIAGAIVLLEAGVLTEPGGGWRQAMARSLPRMAPYALLSAVVPVTLLMLKTSSGSLLGDLSAMTGDAPAQSRWEYLVSEFRVIVAYLRLTALPTWQNFDPAVRMVNTLRDGLTVGALGLLLLLVASAVRWLRRWPLQAVGVLWLALTILPTSSVVVILDPMFEHRMYLPLAGWAVALAASLTAARRTLARRGMSPAGAIACAVVIIVLLGLLTIRRNRTWGSSQRLWEDTARKSPTKTRPLMNLGSAFNAAGYRDRSLAQYYLSMWYYRPYAEALNNIGIVFGKLRLAERELAAYEWARRVNPEEKMVLSNLSNVYAREKRYAKAMFLLKEGLALDPTPAVLYNNLGALYIKLDDPRRALGLLRRAARIDPYLAPSHTNSSNAFLALEQRDRALYAALWAFHLDPSQGEVHNNLGTLYTEAGRDRRAARYFRSAVRLEPELAQSRAGLSRALGNLGYDAQAMYAVKVALLLDPRHELGWVQVGDLYRRARRLRRAAAAYRRALAVNADNASSWNSLGYIWSLEGKLDRSLAARLSSVEADPRYPRAWNNLGGLYPKRGRIAAGERALRRALALQPNYEQAHNNLGSVFSQQGRSDAAMAQFKIALRLNPGRLEGVFNIASMLKARGRKREALAWYERFARRWRGGAQLAAAAQGEMTRLRQQLKAPTP